MAEISTEPNPNLTEEDEEAQVQIWDYIFCFSKMAVVKCAMDLGIADAVENHRQPITLSELSAALTCSPPLLYRILRFLTHYNFFKQRTNTHNETTYVNTPLSRRLLLKNAEKSMRDLFVLECSPAMLGPWHALSNTVLGKGTPFEEVNGDELWKFGRENPDHGKMFNDAMACDAAHVVPAMAEGCGEELEGVESMVDVGGGNGAFLRKMVKVCPWIRGVNYDAVHVVCGAPVIEGVEHVGGDMFECVPKAQVAFLKWVLHDWNDQECIKILKNCREAIPKDKGKVMIVEAVIGAEKNDRFESVKLMFDMVVMAHTSTGKERTSKEWKYILHQAGFSHFKIIPIRAVQSVIVAFP